MLYEHILKLLKQVEIEFEVKVLYACESGSRAWGYPSTESDFDMRFIYVHQPNWYLSIDDHRDVIEIPKKDRLSIETHSLLDVNGWELKKALKLLRKSNPTLLEWLHTDMVYYEAYSTINRMKWISSKNFDPIPCLFHYLKMARRNIKDYLHGEKVKIKKYFTILRPIFAAKWIKEYGSFPPVEFEQILNGVLQEGELKDYIFYLLERKKAGEEVDKQPRIDYLQHSLEAELMDIEAYTKNMNPIKVEPTKQLNELFRETLTEVWK
ncbi:nucleotidyltransferase domain-containing protein [Neobacillus sp. D3-1R]|uniref:nucleotidyltransferase domain-containing protein n=1 Tax=Neobacillus sp. D3-1R TaxID=3445778 RepID=UPI003FA0BB1D